MAFVCQEENMKKTNKKKKEQVHAYYAGLRLHLPPEKAYADKRRKNRSAARAELKKQLRNDEL